MTKVGGSLIRSANEAAEIARSGITKTDPVLTIEVVRFEEGTFYASASKDGDVFWGVIHSKKDVPDLLRNLAEALEKINEMSPGQFPQLFKIETP